MEYKIVTMKYKKYTKKQKTKRTRKVKKSKKHPRIKIDEFAEEWLEF